MPSLTTFVASCMTHECDPTGYRYLSDFSTQLQKMQENPGSIAGTPRMKLVGYGQKSPIAFTTTTLALIALLRHLARSETSHGPLKRLPSLPASDARNHRAVSRVSPRMPPTGI